MRFDTYGPFLVHKTDNQVLRSQKLFWEAVDYEATRWGYASRQLEQAIGCYALVMYDRVYRPWYVGKTLAKAGFRGEIFEDHKLRIYTEYVSERRGTPYMFLFPLLTDGGAFSKARSSASETVDWLEKTLIGMAFAKNRLLRNVASTKHLRTVTVSGLIGPRAPGRPNGYVVEARHAFLATPRPPRAKAVSPLVED
ncbi:hypothetical protein ASG51_22435 [Methylobacterium sp. Leaf465]|uniref:hypothetical protein n=1 Tax=Methylobacterium sp. Leaf465 TaxID=1736385 RepID=UPI0006F265A2|nr:hypothetical protein [Methylobacterium sp. Leaf465]KQT77467.1 hypothetical protein ASG51_22435 [Methylobacterium sp. Leaf465]